MLQNPARATECAALSPFGNLVAYKQALGPDIWLMVTNAEPDASRRSSHPVCNLGPSGGNYLETGPDPIRQRLMGNDRMSWDMRVDDPTHRNVLYFTKFNATIDLVTHIYQPRSPWMGRPVGHSPIAPSPITAQAIAPAASPG